MSQSSQLVSKRRVRRFPLIPSIEQKDKRKSRDSPFSKLNDICVRNILLNIDLDTLCCIANVCKRLRQLAELVFSEQYTPFRIRVCELDATTFRRVMCKFGHLIWSFEGVDGYGRNDVNAIAKFGTHLECLILRSVTIRCDVDEPAFVHLKRLHVESCEFIGEIGDFFNHCPQLTHLYFKAKYFPTYVLSHFPKLNGRKCLNDRNHAYFTFSGLVERTPLLKQLHIEVEPDDEHILAIVQWVPRLESLIIQPRNIVPMPKNQTKKGFLHLAKLKRLKHLTIQTGHYPIAELTGPLIAAFSNANTPIEHLELRNFNVDTTTIKHLCHLNTITKLCLHQINQVHDRHFVSIASELSALTSLELFFNRYASFAQITVIGLINLIQNGHQLTNIKLWGIRNLEINQKVFEHLLAVQNHGAEKELDIYIDCTCKSTVRVDIPQMLQLSYQHQLAIVCVQYRQFCACDYCR